VSLVFVTNLSGIATTADAVRDELLRVAKKIPNSPLANANPDDVALTDGMLVSRRDGSRCGIHRG
jgi:xanthine dehydrogenase YagR molybdenum-binding subunit